MRWNMEVQMEYGLLRLMMKVPGTGFMQLLCLLSLLHRAAPAEPEGDVPQLGAMKARKARRVGVWNNSPRVPGKYFSPHAVLSNSMYHRHYFDLKCSLLLSCLPCLFSVFLPWFPLSLHIYFFFTDDYCGFVSVRSPLCSPFSPHSANYINRFSIDLRCHHHLSHQSIVLSFLLAQDL